MSSMIDQYQKSFDENSAKYGENTLILLQCGKFFELYARVMSDGSASNSMKRATEIMNIKLTVKENGTLFSGFPLDSLHKYASVLTQIGWTLVVIEQSAKKDGRKITRILSPGTHIETNSSLQSRTTCASLVFQNDTISTSLIDISTGEIFSYSTTQSDEILHMFQVYSTKEVFVVGLPLSPASSGRNQEKEISMLKGKFGHAIKYHISSGYILAKQSEFMQEEYLRKMFRLKNLLPVRTSLQLNGKPEIEESLCILLHFIEDHFPDNIQTTEKITSHILYNPEYHMRLSNNILEQLNIITTNDQKSILSIVDKTNSAIGKRNLRERILRPLGANSEKIMEERWEQVEWFSNNPTSSLKVQKSLKALYDIPRLHHKLSGGKITSTDLYQMIVSYQATACMMKELENTPFYTETETQDLFTQFHEYRDHVKRLFDEEKGLRNERGEPVGFLTSIGGPLTLLLEQKVEAQISGWNSLWKDFCERIGISPASFSLVQKVDGEFVWEGARNLSKMLHTESKKPDCFLKGFEVDLSKKSGNINITCAEFYSFSDSLRQTVSKMNKSLEEELLVVCDDLWSSLREFQNFYIDWIGLIDSSLTLSLVASQQGWVKPTIGSSLEIKGLKHPLIYNSLTRSEYVTHDVKLAKGNAEGMLLYGVNASGKSSLMKATGIAVLLAQAGSFVPADSMIIRPYDAAFSRIWNQDNVWAGLSSFAVEMSELRDILTLASDRSLVLGDEVCSGTESSSATALVASTVEYLQKVGTHFIFATHLHDLMKISGFVNNNLSVFHLKVERTSEGKLLYHRTLSPGSGSATYGLEVAKCMGIPFTVMERAVEIRRQLAGEVSYEQAPKSVWNSNLQRVHCEICSSPLVKDLEVHHIHQRSEGGKNELRNLVVLCEKCHDKHHAGNLEIGVLRQTSEGLERVVEDVSPLAPSATSKKSEGKKYKVWTDEQMQSISESILKYKGRPSSRVITDLLEKGIVITAAQLKKF